MWAHLLDACNPVSAGCPVAVRTIEVGADPVEQAECEFLRLELTQCTVTQPGCEDVSTELHRRLDGAAVTADPLQGILHHVRRKDEH